MMSTLEFNQLVTKHTHTLKPFALSLTRDMEDAKDLLQETVFKALSSQEKYTEDTNLKAWLYTIMKNIFINNYRRKVKRKTIIETSDGRISLQEDYGSSIPNGGESQIAVADITGEIDKLNAEYRIPFLMHYQGFKYHEIAEHLILPIGTVKSRIHFARKELKKKLRRN